ncbi:MAG TPA: fibrobacter succinogenes major paralogous domain-containing protein [Bacteroidales bacterium]|nr:fibrobacter succinogenes major paralogous domain-containing protein [Bacteroidales bacterium]
MKKHLSYIFIFAVLSAAFVFVAFQQQSVQVQPQKIKTIKVGYQEWMAENLNVVRFRNGDLIPHVKTDQEWKAYTMQKKPAWCFYENDPANEAKYGRMYNWYAVTDPRGLAPEGYRIPIDYDWQELARLLGSEELAGYKMKSTSGWNEDGNGSNTSNFSAMPGGYRHYHGQFSSVGDNGFWWSADTYDDENSNACYLSKNVDDFYRNFFFRGYGFSVRCIKE